MEFRTFPQILVLKVLDSVWKRAVAVFGWHFFRALHTESEMRRKAEVEQGLLKDKLAAATKW